MRAMPPIFSGIISKNIALSDLHKSWIMLQEKSAFFPAASFAGIASASASKSMK